MKEELKKLHNVIEKLEQTNFKLKNKIDEGKQQISVFNSILSNVPYFRNRKDLII